MKKLKKAWVLLLGLCMAVMLLPMTAFAGNPDVDGNVRVVIQYNPALTGEGTQDNPYYGELNYRSSKIDSTTIETENPLASINGNGNSLKVTLDYGWNDIKFSVTSADGQNTAYYYIRWSRTKLQREEDLKSSDVAVVPANGTAADGKITGLDPEDTYQYRPKGSSEWITVSGVSEITGLAEGTYEIKYGESATHQAQGGSAASVTVGNSQKTMDILNESPFEIEVQASASGNERVAFKIKLDQVKPISDVAIKWYYSPPSGWGSSGTITQWTITGFESGEGSYYALGYFSMPEYKEGRVVKFENVTVVEDTYYAIEKPDPMVAYTTITPENSNDALVLDGEKLYKEGSTVTIELAPNTSSGVEAVNGFSVNLEDGTTVATSTDGKSVSVVVTGNLKITDVNATYCPADFTAMEEQLARLEGVDLTLYTDSTRVVVEERVALVKEMYKCLAKDQYLVDEFVPTLQAAIDQLTPKVGDYTKIQEMKEAIPQDLSVYEEETVEDLYTALENAQKPVDEGWNRLRQTEIDQLADELEAAIAALRYKPADYSKVEAAIQKAEALNQADYKDFSKVEEAINAVVYGKNITEQAEVDNMAKAIEDAIAALEKAPIEPEQPTDQDTKPTKPVEHEKTAGGEKEASNTPQTGDNSSTALWVVLLVLASGSMAGIVLYTRKHKTK